MRISDWSSDVCSSDLPGKIRFQYQKGVPLLIVGDGSRLTMIDYEVNQVQSWPVKNSPLGALLDPDRDISRYAKLIPTDSRDVLSVEVKDPKRPEYGTITMVFVRDAASPAGLRLRGWVALDSQNNRTRIDLSNQKDRKSTRLNSSHSCAHRLPSSA